jgi:hypothetical protein
VRQTALVGAPTPSAFARSSSQLLAHGWKRRAARDVRVDVVDVLGSDATIGLHHAVADDLPDADRSGLPFAGAARARRGSACRPAAGESRRLVVEPLRHETRAVRAATAIAMTDAACCGSVYRNDTPDAEHR